MTIRYHEPVLLKESINGLNIIPNGVYVDVTFGGGGHSREILGRLNKGKLFAFDQDTDANKNSIKEDNFKLLNSNFRNIKNILRIEGVDKIDGLIADLGVSSHQFNVAERGFSTRFSGNLDMRMNMNTKLNAQYIINNYSEEELANLLFQYGELRNSRKIAKTIVMARKDNEISTTVQLADILGKLSIQRKQNQFISRVFQAIRIHVNDEINALKEMLCATVNLLKEGGRLSIISYHSLEDRLVKNIIKKGNTDGSLNKDFYGNPQKPFKEITKKVIIPSFDEIQNNPRSRSAKLRIAEKI